MNDLPNVPNWLLWLATFATLSVVLWSVANFLWQRWLSDVWAKRNREAAKSKAKILIRQFRAALFLVDDDRKFQAISTTVLTDLILGFILLVLGGSSFVLISVELVPVPDWAETQIFIFGAFFVFLGVSTVKSGLEGRRRYIKPYIDWEKYYDTTLDRIKSLHGDAGLNESELAKFIDEVVSVVDKEIPQLEEDEIEVSESP